MSKYFGRIAKIKTYNELTGKTVIVKTWRAKLAEKLMQKDIDYLRHEVEQEIRDDFVEEATDRLCRWWLRYQYSLDYEMMEVFPEHQPSVVIELQEPEEAIETSSVLYKKVRIDGNYVALIPRFKRIKRKEDG